MTFFPQPSLEYAKTERKRLALSVAVFTILMAYFNALQNGKGGDLTPNPDYPWRFYKPPMTLERMRAWLVNANDYLSEAAQMGWANNQRPKGAEKATAGPGLDRLPDLAVVALFQELDAIYAEHEGNAGREAKGC